MTIKTQSTIRKDSWAEDDDLILAEAVLKHIRTGSTQTRALEEVAKLLNRTVTACTVRWNAVLKPRYETAIKIAKKVTGVTPEEETKETKEITANKNKQEEQEEKTIKEEVREKEKTKIVTKVIAKIEEEKKQKQPKTQPKKEEELENAIRVISQHLKNYVQMEKENKSTEELQKQVEKLKKENEILREENQTIKEDYQEMLKILTKAKQMIS